MTEHRKGLNRTLFWLYSGHGRRPSVFRWSMLVFDLVTIGIFLIHPLVSWHQVEVPQAPAWLVVDVFIATVIALDFFARLYIERHKWRFFMRPTNWADLIVLVTLVTPALSQNFSFLRVFRIVRLVRAFEFLDQKTMVGRWLNINSFVVAKVVNLVVFVFLVTALVYVSQGRHNPHITSYLDALYFTIGTLTPVGLGDIALPDTLGRWITISVMVLGVTLFLQLIRAIAVADKIYHHCPACQLPLHDRDAAPASAAARAFFPKAG